MICSCCLLESVVSVYITQSSQFHKSHGMVEFAYKLQLHYDIYMLVFPIWMVKIIKLQILLGSCKLCAKRSIP